MQQTAISWADYVWNPVVGCSKHGPECENCWAERFARRQERREDSPDYLSPAAWTQENAEHVVTTLSDRLDEPVEYTYPDGPGVVYVVSMGDLFHREVSDWFIREVVDRAREVDKQQFAFLTKRPERAASIDIDWPPNAIVGTSVGSGPGGEYPDTTHRIDDLHDVDARRWISFEPLIEPVGSVDLSGIEWIVVGGETGPEADRRPMEAEWARDLYEQARSAGVAFHFKQDSGANPGTNPRLTVYDDNGVPEQRLIRDRPPVPDRVQRARNGGESA